MLSMGPNWTRCSRGDSGAGEEAVCCRQLSPQGRTRAHAPCPRAVVTGKREDLCSEAQAYGNPFGAKGQATGSKHKHTGAKPVWRW